MNWNNLELPEAYYQDDAVYIINADCREVLPLIPDKSIDLVLTDPPYGMSWNGKVTRGRHGTGSRGPTRSYGQTVKHDDKPFDPSPWIAYNRVILWGFHHYSSRLPEGSVLVWIKRYDTGYGSFLSDADLAWMKGGYGVENMKPEAIILIRGLYPDILKRAKKHYLSLDSGVDTWMLIAGEFENLGIDISGAFTKFLKKNLKKDK